jgi:hypothetical protein
VKKDEPTLGAIMRADLELASDDGAPDPHHWVGAALVPLGRADGELTAAVLPHRALDALLHEDGVLQLAGVALGEERREPLARGEQPVEGAAQLGGATVAQLLQVGLKGHGGQRTGGQEGPDGHVSRAVGKRDAQLEDVLDVPIAPTRAEGRRRPPVTFVLLRTKAFQQPHVAVIYGTDAPIVPRTGPHQPNGCEVR